MPRPKKTEPIAEELSVNEDSSMNESIEENLEDNSDKTQPEPIVITVPLGHVFGSVGMVSNTLPPPSDRGMLFIVNDRGNPVCTVYEDSPKLIEFLESNKLELGQRISQLKQTVTDEKELVRMNLPFSASNYDSVAQYQAQNGLAPTEPSIKTWMDFYKKENYEQTDEEIALRVFGDLRWSFIPTKMAD